MNGIERSKILLLKLAPVCVGIFCLSLFLWSWDCWVSPIIDYGREVYVPWQLELGHRLYSDIAYFNGPLSPTFDALVFLVFGTGLNSIVWADLIIVIGIIFFTFKIIKNVTDVFTAYIAVLMFIAVFAFNQEIAVASFNFISPYNQEITHGILLGLAAIYYINRFLENRSQIIYLVITAFILGLLFQTKVEYFAAGFGACFLTLVLFLIKIKMELRDVIRTLLVFFASFFIPILIMFIWLAHESGIEWALRGISGGWIYVFKRSVVGSYYQNSVIGIIGYATNLKFLIRGLIADTLIVLPFVSLAYIGKKIDRISSILRKCLFGILLVSYLVILTIYSEQIPWWLAVRPLPVFVSIIIIFIAFRLINTEYSPISVRQLYLLCFSLYSLILLFRILLNARVDHYGFALAFPGTMLMVCLLIYFLPTWVKSNNGNGLFVKIMSLALLVSFAFAQHIQSDKYYAAKTAAIASDRDLFYGTPEMAEMMNLVVNKINKTLKPNETLLVVPEGVMINYLARRIDPIRETELTPPAIDMWGEKELLHQVVNAKPDYVLFVNRDTSEFGFSQFGSDYGVSIMKEIKDKYKPSWLVGKKPDPQKNFTFILFKRNKSKA